MAALLSTALGAFHFSIAPVLQRIPRVSTALLLQHVPRVSPALGKPPEFNCAALLSSDSYLYNCPDRDLHPRSVGEGGWAADGAPPGKGRPAPVPLQPLLPPPPLQHLLGRARWPNRADTGRRADAAYRGRHEPTRADLSRHGPTWASTGSYEPECSLPEHPLPERGAPTDGRQRLINIRAPPLSR